MRIKGLWRAAGRLVVMMGVLWLVAPSLLDFRHTSSELWAQQSAAALRVDSCTVEYRRDGTRNAGDSCA